jgi:hypothetical protein
MDSAPIKISAVGNLAVMIREYEFKGNKKGLIIKPPAGIEQPEGGYVLLINLTAKFPLPLISAPDVGLFEIVNKNILRWS